jgi:diguanylate cyclase (GGDEF)-like protein/PAS domain S-box-containing protein
VAPWSALLAGTVFHLRGKHRAGEERGAQLPCVGQADDAAEEKLRTIVEHIPVAVWMTEAEASRVLFVNEAYAAIWGHRKQRFYADPASWLRQVHPEDAERVVQSLSGRGNSSGYEINYRILRDDGEVRYIRETGRRICAARDRSPRWVVGATDISSEMYVRDELHELNSRLREANLRLRESARLDGLTQCLNRSAFFDEAEKALQLGQRYGRCSAMVFFDLNNFKEVNDNFGHHVGDRALIAFAEHIKSRVRTTDELGRYGGDEFVALLRETDADQARQLLATLLPVVVDAEQGNSVILRFSAGVACSSEADVETVDDWMRSADAQMYHHKIRHNR